MKKVGIITMISNNFGNRLQNYAMQEYLKKLHVEPETIYNYVYEYPKKKKHIVDIPRKIYSKLKRLIQEQKFKNIENKRNKKFAEFNSKYIIFSKEKIENTQNLKDFERKYHNFIVGSDQVWNPYAYRNKDIDFLTFSPKEKNISYAVSFAVENIEDKFKDVYIKGLKNFNYISVRESRGVEIAKELTGRNDIEQLIDPTMLIDIEDWKKIEEKPIILENKKYILNYFLGTLSKERKKIIEEFAKKNNCEIINILDKKSDFYDIGPSEFIYLERNAYLICTDSYHSCVFAILFNVPFIVFNREDDLISMNSRIDTLLETFKLQNRKYEGKIEQNTLKCNYSESYKILEEERKRTKKFLEKALIT